MNTLAGEFDPEKYHDEYREEVLALIERKAAGEEIVAPAAPEEPAKVLDLMAALEASLARTGAKQTPSAPATARSRREEGGGQEGPRPRRRRRRRRHGAGQAHPQVGLTADRARYEAWGMRDAGRDGGGGSAGRATDGHLGADVLVLEPAAVAQRARRAPARNAGAGLEPDRVGPEHHARRS